MKRLLLAIAGITVAPDPAMAQALRCAVPAQPGDSAGPGGARGERRVTPVVGYTLALSWNPGYCRQAGNASAFQCGGGNRFGFILHGLWPDGPGGRWPQFCAPPRTIPRAVVRETLCVMPDPRLQWQQYAKHGSCTGLDPAAYFERARATYGRVRYPDMDDLSRQRDLTAGRFAAAFARANPGISQSMLSIRASRDGWLDEVQLCLDTGFRPRICPPQKRGLPDRARLRIWRGD